MTHADTASSPISHIIRVGQDRRGHWLVQDDAGLVEGFFTSRKSAIGFAREECDLLHAQMEIAPLPLTSRVSTADSGVMS